MYILYTWPVKAIVILKTLGSIPAAGKLVCLSPSSLAVISLIHTKTGRDAEIYFCDYAYIKIAFNASIQIYSIPVVIGVLVSHLQADPAQRFTNPFESRIARAK